MCHLMLSFINSGSAMTVGSCFQAISRRFWGGLCFVLLVGFCTKRRPWPNSLKPQLLSSPTSASVENHVLAAFEGFWRISRRFWRGSSLCTFGGILYKTKILAKFVENRANIIVPRFCFRLESCLIYFQAISRLFWRGPRFWVIGLRFVPTP